MLYINKLPGDVVSTQIKGKGTGLTDMGLDIGAEVDAVRPHAADTV